MPTHGAEPTAVVLDPWATRGGTTVRYLGLMLALAVLAGCGGHGPPRDAREQAYLDTVPRSFGDTDTALLQLGDEVCWTLDAGMSYAESALHHVPASTIYVSVLSTIMGSGYSADRAGRVIGASIAVFCPHHADLIPDLP